MPSTPTVSTMIAMMISMNREAPLVLDGLHCLLTLPTSLMTTESL